MISNGYYDANLISYGLISSESPNNPEQFAAEFEIIEGEHAGESITWFGYFSDAAFPYTMEKIRRMGLVGSDLRKLTRSHDKPVRIGVKQEVTPKGETVARVKSIGGGSIVAAKALAPAQAATFAQRMEARIKAWDAQTGGPQPVVPRPNGGTRPASPPSGGGDPIEEDQIPF